ncbi:hypothetical protein AN2V17_00030 [Vallitalea sp. AN17-2]|uniref:Uncharacterized protein n=1 Tax=Vallitalea maricola TaxID=3074433 RepID=A0ACB5UCR8_9FIRM|nr:hypothetical protein AN2V17_00030 [Vallitalea sp. AN17-2]
MNNNKIRGLIDLYFVVKSRFYFSIKDSCPLTAIGNYTIIIVLGDIIISIYLYIQVYKIKYYWEDCYEKQSKKVIKYVISSISSI